MKCEPWKNGFRLTAESSLEKDAVWRWWSMTPSIDRIRGGGTTRTTEFIAIEFSDPPPPPPEPAPWTPKVGDPVRHKYSLRRGVVRNNPCPGVIDDGKLYVGVNIDGHTMVWRVEDIEPDPEPATPAAKPWEPAAGDRVRVIGGTLRVGDTGIVASVAPPGRDRHRILVDFDGDVFPARIWYRPEQLEPAPTPKARTVRVPAIGQRVRTPFGEGVVDAFSCDRSKIEVGVTGSDGCTGWFGVHRNVADVVPIGPGPHRFIELPEGS